MLLNELNSLFSDFLDKFDGFESSYNAKNNYTGERDISTMTYGEINANSAFAIINILRDFCKLNRTESVIDLGSGIGKVILAMHYTDLFKFIVGVELLEGLYSVSLKMFSDYSKKYYKYIDNIHVFNDDILNTDISKYDIIISNTAVDNELRQNIINKINNEARTGALVISSITSFEASKLKPVRRFATKWSWGASHINASIKE